MEVGEFSLVPCHAVAHISSRCGVSLTLSAKFIPTFDRSGFHVDISYRFNNRLVKSSCVSYDDNVADVFLDFIAFGDFSMIHEVTGVDDGFIIDELVVYYGVVSYL